MKKIVLLFLFTFLLHFGYAQVNKTTVLYTPILWGTWTWEKTIHYSKDGQIDHETKPNISEGLRGGYFEVFPNNKMNIVTVKDNKNTVSTIPSEWQLTNNQLIIHSPMDTIPFTVLYSTPSKLVLEIHELNPSALSTKSKIFLYK